MRHSEAIEGAYVQVDAERVTLKEIVYVFAHHNQIFRDFKCLSAPQLEVLECNATLKLEHTPSYQTRP